MSSGRYRSPRYTYEEKIRVELAASSDDRADVAPLVLYTEILCVV